MLVFAWILRLFAAAQVKAPDFEFKCQHTSFENSMRIQPKYLHTELSIIFTLPSPVVGRFIARFQGSRYACNCKAL